MSGQNDIFEIISLCRILKTAGILSSVMYFFVEKIRSKLGSL